MLFTCNQGLKLYVNNINLNVKVNVSLRLKFYLPKNCYSQHFHFLPSTQNKNVIKKKKKNFQEGARDLLGSASHQGVGREGSSILEGLGLYLSKSNSFAEVPTKNGGQDQKDCGMKLKSEKALMSWSWSPRDPGAPAVPSGRGPRCTAGPQHCVAPPPPAASASLPLIPSTQHS